MLYIVIYSLHSKAIGYARSLFLSKSVFLEACLVPGMGFVLQ